MKFERYMRAEEFQRYREEFAVLALLHFPTLESEVWAVAKPPARGVYPLETYRRHKEDGYPFLKLGMSRSLATKDRITGCDRYSGWHLHNFLVIPQRFFEPVQLPLF